MIVDVVPLAALLLGIVWATWAARPRKGPEPHESVEQYQRVLHALEPGASKAQVTHHHLPTR